MSDYNELKPKHLMRHGYLRDRNMYSKEKEIEFENYGSYSVQYSVATGAWIRILYGHNLNLLFALELSYKSYFAHPYYGLKHGLPLKYDSLGLQRTAALRLFKPEERVAVYTKDNKLKTISRVELELEEWKKDTVAWLAFEYIETKRDSRQLVDDWVIKRYKNPKCSIYVDTEDIVEWRKKELAWEKFYRKTTNNNLREEVYNE